MNGCIRRQTLQDFLAEEQRFYEFPEKITLEEGFFIFSLVHSVITSPQRLHRIVTEVLEDFESQNCVYIELRTTPKQTALMSKNEYINVISNAINQYTGKIIAKLIISINRSQSLKDAWENLEIAMNCETCVGLDFSGDPRIGKFNDFVEIFKKGRENGLKITLHTAEILDDEDTISILNFIPDRLGHCNFLSEECKEIVLRNKIPIEMCISSNMNTLNLSSVFDHHFEEYYSQNHPVAICTDDTLLFDTTLTKELEIISDAYKLSSEQIFKIMENSMSMAFGYNSV